MPSMTTVVSDTMGLSPYIGYRAICTGTFFTAAPQISLWEICQSIENAFGAYLSLDTGRCIILSGACGSDLWLNPDGLPTAAPSQHILSVSVVSRQLPLFGKWTSSFDKVRQGLHIAGGCSPARDLALAAPCRIRGSESDCEVSKFAEVGFRWPLTPNCLSTFWSTCLAHRNVLAVVKRLAAP